MRSAAVRIAADPAHVIVGDASTATFAFTWAGSGRTNTPWSRAVMACRETTCNNNNTCIAARCYDDAAAAWHPIRGDGSSLTTPFLMRLAYGPNIKLVIMLRDPVERLHASFWGGDHYLNKYGKDEAGFAAFVDDTLAAFAACVEGGHTREECVMAFEAWSQTQEDGAPCCVVCARCERASSQNRADAPASAASPLSSVFYHCDQLAKGAYSVFLRRWLAAFPKSDVLVLRLEDYIRVNDAATADTPVDEGGPSGRVGVARTLKALHRHLGLDAPDEGAWAAMVAAPVARATPAHDRFGAGSRAEPADIDAAVRARVKAFYDPFDAELEALLGAPGFADWHGDKSFV